MNYPEWVDEKISEDLLVLVARGERQNLEFKGEFPENAQKLGAEIAAFATSNAGVILIGVTNDGEIVGLANTDSAQERDKYLRRIEGICQGSVKPAITPLVSFALSGDKVVLVINVSKGSQPIYYYNSRPYLRHITESRPAEPHEVVELFEKWFEIKGLSHAKEDNFSEYLSRLGSYLHEVIIFGEEIEERSINPWLDFGRSQYQEIANNLRELALEEIASKNNVSQRINQLANILDQAANFRLALGKEKWEEFESLVKNAVKASHEILIDCFEGKSMVEEDLENAKDLIQKSFKKLEDLDKRGEEMINQGRLEELQEQVSEVGHTLLLISFYPINPLKENLDKELKEIGRDLHLIETHRTYMDGGKSLQAILQRVSNGYQKFKELVKNLN